MIRNLHILVSIDLEDVAALLVDGEASHHIAPVKVPAADDLQAAECEGDYSLPSSKSINGSGCGDSVLHADVKQNVPYLLARHNKGLRHYATQV